MKDIIAEREMTMKIEIVNKNMVTNDLCKVLDYLLAANKASPSTVKRLSRVAQAFEKRVNTVMYFQFNENEHTLAMEYLRYHALEHDLALAAFVNAENTTSYVARFNKELKKLSNKNSIGLFEKSSSEFKLRVYVGVMTETYETDVSLAVKLFCQ